MCGEHSGLPQREGGWKWAPANKLQPEITPSVRLMSGLPQDSLARYIVHVTKTGGTESPTGTALAGQYHFKCGCHLFVEITGKAKLEHSSVLDILLLCAY